MDTKRLLKENVINVILSLVVTVIGYWAFRYTGVSAENWFYPIIFLLVLILLKLPNKK